MPVGGLVIRKVGATVGWTLSGVGGTGLVGLSVGFPGVVVGLGVATGVCVGLTVENGVVVGWTVTMGSTVATGMVGVIVPINGSLVGARVSVVGSGVNVVGSGVNVVEPAVIVDKGVGLAVRSLGPMVGLEL
jgi:hypothetical protein